MPRGIRDSLLNKTFGNLTVIEESESKRYPSGVTQRFWLCLCICGNKKSILSSDLKKGNVVSCGCKKNDVVFSTEDFVRESKIIHNNRYDYSKVQYFKSSEKVEIICHEHGSWTATPNSHLKGVGCKKCMKSGWDYLSRCSNKEFADKDGCLYLLKLSKGDETFGKIGVSVNIDSRIRNFQSEGILVDVLEIVKLKAIESAILENKILSFIKSKNYVYRPKFNFGGYSECFDLDGLENILKYKNTLHLPGSFLPF